MFHLAKDKITSAITQCGFAILEGKNSRLCLYYKELNTVTLVFQIKEANMNSSLPLLYLFYFHSNENLKKEAFNKSENVSILVNNIPQLNACITSIEKDSINTLVDIIKKICLYFENNSETLLSFGKDYRRIDDKSKIGIVASITDTMAQIVSNL